MNNINLESYAKEIVDKFSNKITKVHWNNDELHLKTELNDMPKICDYVYKNLNARLATIICSDERKNIGGFTIRYVFEKPGIFIFVIVSTGPSLSFPSISLHIQAATLYEREIKDMFGLVPIGNPDTRPLVLHEHWPDGVFPLRKEFELKTKTDRQKKEYRFLRVQGEGICEIPVGPVHAGIIEPGHFRFSILGENIIHLETRLFYTHKGIEKLAESMKLDDALLLSERIAGDESVANSSAFCQAIEKIAQVEIPKRTKKIRTIFAELERVYNHMGTLAGISTDASFPFGAARLNILKERLMRLNESLSGSRILFGVNRIGGVRCDITDENKKLILETLSEISDDFDKVIILLKSKSSFMDRLRGTGVIPKKVAYDLGTVGIVARCVGMDVDTRSDHPYGSYGFHDSKTPQELMQHQIDLQKRTGDAMARFEIRVHEVRDSIDVVTKSLDLETDSLFTSIPERLEPFRSSLGYAESHRGQTLHWLMIGEGNSIFRYKIRTASFCNWPVIEQAVLNDIVPDFPLVNKSLDLSYSGNDL